MRIPRLFCQQALAAHSQIRLDAEAARHAARVLRLREGAEVILFDGSGGEYPGRLLRIAKSQVTVTVGELLRQDRESPLNITLVQGVSRGERMDFTVQKATELGVQRIIPVQMLRTVVRLSGERAAKRAAHWRAISAQACQQCGRNVLPVVDPIAGFDDWLARHEPGALDLLLVPGAELLEAAQPPASVTLAVGPEGGFAPQERELLVQKGFIGLALGPRILRTETAALAAVSVIQARWGDMLG